MQSQDSSKTWTVQYAGSMLGCLAVGENMLDELRSFLVQHDKSPDNIVVFQHGQPVVLDRFCQSDQSRIMVVTSGWASRHVMIAHVATAFNHLGEQMLLRIAKPSWNRRVAKFANLFLQVWQDYSKLADQLDQLCCSKPDLSDDKYCDFLRHHICKHQHDARMINLIHMVVAVWWRSDIRACQANIKVVAALVLDQLDRLDRQDLLGKLHWVDLLFVMFDLDDMCTNATYNALMCDLVVKSGKAVVLAEMAAKLCRSEIKHCTMLHRILSVVMTSKAPYSLPEMVGKILAAKHVQYWLMQWQTNRDGFWPAFFKAGGPGLAASDFEHADRNGLSNLLRNIPSHAASDPAWKVFGQVLRDWLRQTRQGKNTSWETVDAAQILQSCVVRQSFVKCQGLAELAMLMTKPAKRGLFLAQLQQLYCWIRPTQQDRHGKMLIQAHAYMQDANRKTYYDQPPKPAKPAETSQTSQTSRTSPLGTINVI